MWGPNGHGAVLLVNCDSETGYFKTTDSDKDEISKVSGKFLRGHKTDFMFHFDL